MFKEKNLKFAVILHSPTYNSHWDSWRSILHYCILFYCTPLPRVHIEIHGDPYYIIIFCSTALLYLQFTLRFMEIHITLLFSVLLHSSTDNQHLNKWRFIIVCFFIWKKSLRNCRRNFKWLSICRLASPCLQLYLWTWAVFDYLLWWNPYFSPKIECQLVFSLYAPLKSM